MQIPRARWARLPELTLRGLRLQRAADPFHGRRAHSSYFGLRTFELGDGPNGKRPLLNGKFTFMAGFLDQSWFPDGQ